MMSLDNTQHSVQVVQEYERAVIFRLGRLRSGGAKVRKTLVFVVKLHFQGPGLFFIVPCIDQYRKVDLRTGAFDVPPQEILTRDSVTVSVDAVVYYQVGAVPSREINCCMYCM